MNTPIVSDEQQQHAASFDDTQGTAIAGNHGGRSLSNLALLLCSGGHSMFSQKVYVSPSSST